MKRRTFLATTLAAAAAPSSSVPRQRLGITIASYAKHWRSKPALPGWQDALKVLDRCQELGAGSLQISVNNWSEDFAGAVREKRESLNVTLEGQISLPKKTSDLDRFEANLKAAKEAGSKILRCVCLGGRRYETFKTLDSWKTFVKESRAALERAEPLLKKHGLKLAVENHKDWRIDEHLELMRHLDSEWIGVNFDFGNNLALLEDPHEMAEALAPYILTTHVKDMGLQPYQDGFLLSEVPLGEGILDLPKLITICRKAKPDIQFNLEMITRDPLKIPVLTEQYWITMSKLPAPDLARTLRLVQDRSAKKLPSTSDKDREAQLALEDAQVRSCFAYAKKHLAL